MNADEIARELARELARAISDLRYVAGHAWDRLDAPEYDVLITAINRLKNIEQQVRAEPVAAGREAA